MENLELYFKDKNITENTRVVTRWVVENIRKMGIDDDYLFACNVNELEDIMVELLPTSPSILSTYCCVLENYMRWVYANGRTDDCENCYLFKKLDKKLIWKRVKPRLSKRFMSIEAYKKVLNDIDSFCEFNSLYYKTLFMAIYEGIYSDDLYVIKQLRASDIQGNVVSLHFSDGSESQLTISNELADNLIELSREPYWCHNVKSGVGKRKLVGEYEDSCFKLPENAKNTSVKDDNYKYKYYYRTRYVCKNFVGHDMLPIQICYNGIMNRIIDYVEKHGIDVNEAFIANKYDSVPIIAEDELRRCNISLSYNNFRARIMPYFNDFIN